MVGREMREVVAEFQACRRGGIELVREFVGLLC